MGDTCITTLKATERVVVEVFIDTEDTDGTFYARDPRRPGCLVDADTEVGTIRKLDEARRLWDDAVLRAKERQS